MFRSIGDFLEIWAEQSTITSRILHSLTPDSLAQPVVAGGRTLGRIAWHLTVSLGDLMHRLGLPTDCPNEEGEVPTLDVICETYDRAARSISRVLKEQWSDAELERVRELFGERLTGSQALRMMLIHEVHHRGQLTILMRQAGLAVPGVVGPSREEWAQWGMAAPV